MKGDILMVQPYQNYSLPQINPYQNNFNQPMPMQNPYMDRLAQLQQYQQGLQQQQMPQIPQQAQGWMPLPIQNIAHLNWN